MIDKLIIFLLKPLIRKHSLKDWQYWRQWRMFMNITVNALFMTAKFTVALLTSSIASLADAVHTASHFVFYLVMAVGIMWIAQFPVDEQKKASLRFRYSTYFLLAFGFIYAGIEFVRAGVTSIKNEAVFEADTVYYYVALLAGIFIIKLFLVRCYSFLDRKQPFTTLVSDTWRHVSDAITSLGVIAVFFAPKADGYVSIGVALFIIYSGYLMAQEASIEVTDPDKKNPVDIEEVAALLRKCEKVCECDDVVVQHLGKKTVVLATLTLNEDNVSGDSETLRDELEKLVHETFNVKAFITIHEPDDGEAID